MIFHGRGVPVVARFLGPGGRKDCCFVSGARRKIEKATGPAASCAAVSPVALDLLRTARLRSTKRQPESAGLGQSRHAFSSRRPGIIFRNFHVGKLLDRLRHLLRHLSRLKHLQPVASRQFPSLPHEWGAPHKLRLCGYSKRDLKLETSSSACRPKRANYQLALHSRTSALRQFRNYSSPHFSFTQ